MDEVEEEADVGVEVDMMTTAVDEGEDMVEEAEDMVEEAEDIVVVGTVADVTIMVVAVAVAEEDMAVSRIYHCYCYSTSSITDDF